VFQHVVFKVTQEPKSISLYRDTYAEKWILLVSYPGLKAPYGTWSVKRVLAAASKLEEAGCHIFMLSVDTWSIVRQIRFQLENKVDKSLCKSIYTRLEKTPIFLKILKCTLFL